MTENITRGALADQVRVHSMPDLKVNTNFTLLFIPCSDTISLRPWICSLLSFMLLSLINWPKFSLTPQLKASLSAHQARLCFRSITFGKKILISIRGPKLRPLDLFDFLQNFTFLASARFALVPSTYSLASVILDPGL